MNMVENNQTQEAKQSKNSPATNSPVDLKKMAKPIGTFGGATDVILRLRKGKPVAADTGEQGGGQN